MPIKSFAGLFKGRGVQRQSLWPHSAECGIPQSRAQKNLAKSTIPKPRGFKRICREVVSYFAANSAGSSRQLMLRITNPPE